MNNSVILTNVKYKHLQGCYDSTCPLLGRGPKMNIINKGDKIVGRGEAAARPY